MNTAKTGVAALLEAEAKLRELVGQAAADGEYDAAVRMATAAKGVAALALVLNGRNVAAEGSGAADVPVLPEFVVPTEPGKDGRGNSTVSSAKHRGGRRKVRAPRRAGRTPRKGEYPKFFREGEYLVKVSWSKKQRCEYQHKAPRRVTELLAAAIGKQSVNGRLFTSEDIFPLKDPQGGDVPSYQAYAALAWLRQSGLVQPHGRRGYTAMNNGHLPERLTAAWKGLPESQD